MSTTYPAFPVDIAQVVNNSGPILGAPVVVTISWPLADTNAATWEDFGDKLGASSYWSAAVGEYGVGAVTSGATNHIRLTQTPPAQMLDTDLTSFIGANIGKAESDAGPAWPAPTLDSRGNSQTIYSVFVPPSMVLMDTSQSPPVAYCDEGVGGYHDDVELAGAPNAPISYAVNFECPALPADAGAAFTPADVEETASHEYAEAATDPFPSFNNGNDSGYRVFDTPHYVYELWNGFQDEVGDACESFKSSYYQETGTFEYWVQRIWSNKAAAAGHNPCAPQPAEPYYNVTLFPAQKQAVTVDLTSVGNGMVATTGFKAPVNQSVTFQIGFISDALTGPFTVSASVDQTLPFPDNSGNNISNGTATVTIDHATGQNGQKAYVTVTPTAAGQLGFQIVQLTSKNPSESYPHYIPILIANQ